MNTAASPSSSSRSNGPWSSRAPRSVRPREVRLATDLSAYLAPTTMCDADHPAVRHVATEVTRGARTQREAAVALFYWVRDEVAYTMGDWSWRASDTLAMRLGTCSNKSNLMVAMARAIGIPAGFHVQYVETSSYFSGGFIPMVEAIARDVAIHVYVTLFLDGRWVRCDPTDDLALCEAIEAFVPHARALDFDGEHDAVIPFAAGSIQSDRGPLADIDGQLSRPARIEEGQKRMFAAYVAYMREHGTAYGADAPAQRLRIEADFRRHLAETEPVAWAAVTEQRRAS